MDASTNDSGDDDDLQDFINSLKPPYQDTQQFQVIIDKDQQLKDTIISSSSQIQGKFDCGLFRSHLQYILYQILGVQDIYVSQLLKEFQSSQIKEFKDENDDQIHHILFQRECERPYITFRIRQHDPLWSWKLTMIEQFKMMDSLRNVLQMNFSPKRMLVIFQKLVKQIRYNISRNMVAEIFDLNRIKCCILKKANEFNKEIQQQEIVLISQITQKIVLYIIGHHYIFPFQKNIDLFIKQYPQGNGIYSDEFLGLIEDPIKFWHLGQKYRNNHQDNLIIKIMEQLRLKFECQQVNNLMRQLLGIIHQHQKKHPEAIYLDFINFFKSKYVSCENIYADIKDLKIKLDNNQSHIPESDIVQPIMQENNAVIENDLAKQYIEKHENKALQPQQPMNSS